MDILKSLRSYNNVINNIEKKELPLVIKGVLSSAKSYLISSICKNLKTTGIIIVSNELEVKNMYIDISSVCNNINVNKFNSKDIFYYTSEASSIELMENRIKVINNLSYNKKNIVILSADALLDKIVSKKQFKSMIFKLNVGQENDFDEVIKKLVEIGYDRVDQVESKGEFSVRGGIVDIYPVLEDDAYRIEFFGDEIDSIRKIDITSQKSISKLEKVTIYPIKDILDYNDKSNSTILDYITDKSLIFLDEPSKIKQKCDIELNQFYDFIKDNKVNDIKDILDIKEEIYLVMKKLYEKQIVIFNNIYDDNLEFNIKKEIKINSEILDLYGNKLSSYIDYLRNENLTDCNILVYSRNKKSIENWKNELIKYNIPVVIDNNVKKYEKGIVYIKEGILTDSIKFNEDNILIVSEKEPIYTKKQKRRARYKKGKKINSFTDIKIGDYIVHDQHGIGIYKGIKKIKIDGKVKDYFKLEYKDEGVLYIGISQMDLIQKYIGSEGKQPRINKLGTVEWTKSKKKVKKSVEELAKKLVELYAERMKIKGFSFSNDTEWQKEFEDTFSYVETDDQLLSIEEIKKDMESNKVMDRLLCGDVGYGKTEVAIRAAFKAVQDNKQVVVLAPTTILVEQHYKTFLDRMKDYPVKIESVSRFKSKKEQKESIDRINSGLSDILIGTHRVLSKDIKFKDLGLIIVDEEQRFGVSQKEKLKNLSINVDVLSLSATPIPRTLHMSLAGIRDMSILEEPPRERKAVQTYVIQKDYDLIKNAIYKEVGRGGQVYYLYNRVKDIHKITQKLKEIMPELSIVFAHGQMRKIELENIMENFIDGNINVLVATSIIETGLDIPNVNTIIIEDADRMGLAQLYQLRGRVGRSTRMAYAYLLYKKDKVLKEMAEKRLKAIKEFTELGSGFKIALRDLEIRGAGNLLGPEQHGHLESVGYDMYCKILDEAVKEVQGKVVNKPVSLNIDININAYIPSSYISNEIQKIEIYKKIANIINEDQMNELWEEIEDRFGNLPKEVKNLLDISYIKSKAIKIGIKQMVQKSNRIIIEFNNNINISIESLMGTVKIYKKKLKLTTSPKTYLTYYRTSLKDEDVLDDLLDIMNKLNSK